jgi:hypothetical protein
VEAGKRFPRPENYFACFANIFRHPFPGLGRERREGRNVDFPEAAMALTGEQRP